MDLKEPLEYVSRYWDKVITHRPEDSRTLIGLPHPYIRANHEMFDEMYYWDSFFIAQGLFGTPLEKIVLGITDNLLYLLERFGRIPNANRFYFLSRSQPPLLSRLVRQSCELRDGGSEAKEWLKHAFHLCEREYREVWRSSKFPDEREVHAGLSRYYDLNIWHQAAEAESGWDMTCRFYNRCLDFLPVDLNSFLFRYEKDLAWICSILGQDDQAARYESEAARRADTVTKLMWDEEQGAFFDFDYVNAERSPLLSIAAFAPLWCGLATEAQAKRLVEKTLPQLEQPYGVVTTAPYEPIPGDPPKQWAWPNGWAPLHWIVIEGLMNYGFDSDARRIAKKFRETVARNFAETGTIYEKYNVVTGGRAKEDRYPDQPGFSWTNAIFYRCCHPLSLERGSF